MNKIDIYLFLVCEMYLRNVLCIGSKDITVDLINKKLINFNDNWKFCCLHHVDGSICVNLSYDFSVITYDRNKYSEYKKTTKEKKRNRQN
jgi:ribosome-associated toxin RatA of RatAB toxin-antitoxin module